MRNFDIRTFRNLQKQRDEFNESMRVNSLLQDYNKDRLRKEKSMAKKIALKHIDHDNKMAVILNKKERVRGKRVHFDYEVNK